MVGEAGVGGGGLGMCLVDVEMGRVVVEGGACSASELVAAEAAAAAAVDSSSSQDSAKAAGLGFVMILGASGEMASLLRDEARVCADADVMIGEEFVIILVSRIDLI